MKILAIGAHHDDVELNCTGTFLKARDHKDEIYLVVCTNGSSVINSEQLEKEQNKVAKKVGYKRTWYLRGRDGYLSHSPELVIELDNIIKEVKPDYVFTHTDKDYHQDHVVVSKAVRSANRRGEFSLWSFPSQNRDLTFESNCSVDITKYLEEKIEILGLYKSQKKRPYFDRDTIISRNIGTGIAKYVEKFHIEFLKL